jgi:hypothetical protein
LRAGDVGEGPRRRPVERRPRSPTAELVGAARIAADCLAALLSPKSGVMVIHGPNENVQMRFRSAAWET